MNTLNGLLIPEEITFKQTNKLTKDRKIIVKFIITNLDSLSEVFQNRFNGKFIYWLQKHALRI